MKRSPLFLALAAALTAAGFYGSGLLVDSTRVGFIVSEAIFEKLPDWQDANAKILAAEAAWKKEYAGMESQYRTKLDSIERYRLIWSANERGDAEKGATLLKQQMSEFWNKKFGPVSSEYSALATDLLKPVHERVFSALQEVAKDEKYDYIIDRSNNDVLLVYANPNHDLTVLVLTKLGVKLEGPGAGAPSATGTNAGRPNPQMPPTTPNGNPFAPDSGSPASHRLTSPR
jgi:Skp family chaperone for outer membrane proteins